MEEKIKILPYGLKGNGEYVDDWNPHNNHEETTRPGRPRTKGQPPGDGQHFTFGKYRGKLVTDVKSSYLTWYYCKIRDRSNPILPTIEKTMESRGHKLRKYVK